MASSKAEICATPICGSLGLPFVADLPFVAALDCHIYIYEKELVVQSKSSNPLYNRNIKIRVGVNCH